MGGANGTVSTYRRLFPNLAQALTVEGQYFPLEAREPSHDEREDGENAGWSLVVETGERLSSVSRRTRFFPAEWSKEIAELVNIYTPAHLSFLSKQNIDHGFIFSKLEFH